MMRRLSVILSCGFLFACADAPINDGLDPFAPKIFKEGSTPLPKEAPDGKNLVVFRVSNNTPFQFGIDAKSIEIGKDGVTRYVISILGPNGTVNSFYEGIRCESFEWKLYGTLDANQVWQPNPLSTWQPIRDRVVNRYQAALAQGPFTGVGGMCDFKIQEKNIATILKKLNPGFDQGANYK